MCHHNLLNYTPSGTIFSSRDKMICKLSTEQVPKYAGKRTPQVKHSECFLSFFHGWMYTFIYNIDLHAIAFAAKKNIHFG